MDEYIKVFHEHGVNITAEEVALYFATKVCHVVPKLCLSEGSVQVCSKYLQDKDRDGLISYEEFCDKKTKTEIAFEVCFFFV